MTADAKSEPKKFEYEVITTFWDGPHLKEAGKDTVWKTEDEARYYEPHILQKKADDTAAKPSATAKQSKAKS